MNYNQTPPSLVFHFSVCLILITVFTSCKKQKEKVGHESTSDIQYLSIKPKEANTISAETLMEDVKFIQLETSDSSLFGEVRKVIVNSSNIFIADYSGGIFIFNKEGKFISKIKKNGRDPWQYIALTDFHLDTVNHTIEILDDPSLKLKEYTWTGDFIRQRNVPLHAIAFTKFKNSFLFYSGNFINKQGPYGLTIANNDNNFSISSQHFTISPELARYLHIRYAYHFHHYNDSVYMVRPLNDTIYNIHGNVVTPSRVIDFGEARINKNDTYSRQYETIMDFTSYITNHDYAYNVGSIIETDAHLLFTYQFRNETHHVFHYKKTGKTIQIKNWSFDFLNGVKQPASLGNFPKAVYQKDFYRVLESHEFVTTMDSLKQTVSPNEWAAFSAKYPQLLAWHKNTHIGDNPILVIFKLKNPHEN